MALPRSRVFGIVTGSDQGSRIEMADCETISWRFWSVEWEIANEIGNVCLGPALVRCHM